MIKNILIILIAFSINSCAAGYMRAYIPNANHLEIEKRFPDNKMAIIIYKAKEPSKSRNSDWYEVEHKKITAKNSGYVGIGSSSQYQIRMIKPGTYSLSQFYLDYNTYVFVPKNKELFENNKPYFIAFKAKPGKVTYIGDISMKFKRVRQLFGFGKGVPYFKVKDNFKDAKQFFENNYPKIETKVTRNLAFTKNKK